MPYAIVKESGFLSTIQDKGRFGLGRYGIPHSGPMDWISFTIANLLVGNKRSDPLIEVTGEGFEVNFDGESFVAITGGEGQTLLNGKSIEKWTAFHVKGGDTIKIVSYKSGFRTYLALRDLKIESVLGSKSTCLPAKFGGFLGRRLLNGDILEIGNTSIRDRTFADKPDWIFKEKVRIVKGPQWSYLRNPEVLKSTYKISRDSDRIGYRLEGERMDLESYEILSEGVAFGTIQVPPNGLPIIMMADHPTTGGYSKIANVIYVDLPVLGQKKSEDEVKFEIVNSDFARNLYVECESWIRKVEYDLCNSRKHTYHVNVNGKDFTVEVKEIE